jgi:hypothetical protein
MNKRSAMVISAGLVFALMFGTVAKVSTLKSGRPVTVVVQTASGQVPAPAATFSEGSDSG